MLFASLLMALSVPLWAANTLNDEDISNAVDHELFVNATTPSYLIDVHTAEGIVTLSGSVNNILAKDRAVKIARTVKGVRGVIDQVEVDAPFRSNQNLKNDVEQALLFDPATDSYEIDVMAMLGHVTLSGTVQSWQERQLSEYVVKAVRGVKSVNNDIRIEYKADRPDQEIQREIEQTFANDVRIDDALIEVDVKDGEVKLSGVVGSANEKSLAFSQAWTSGVKSIDNEGLEVKGWARDEHLRKDKYVMKSDEEIKNAVKDAFLYDPRVFSFNPRVSVDYGVVTLTGTVDNLKAKHAAAQSASNIVGVYRVKNYLKVRPEFIPEDDDLESTIASAMKKNPVVEKWEVDVKANRGVVYLNGVVDSYFERAKAEDIASRTKGVLAVENNLSVLDRNDYYYPSYYGWNSWYPPYHIDVEYAFKSDQAIKEDIVDELWWSPYVNEDEVTVIVDRGKAILTGTVDTKRERLFAEINALEGGANEVENNLVVD